MRDIDTEQLRKVDQEKAGAEGTQQESTANLVTHSVGSSIIGPAVSSLCTTTAARHFVPSTSPVATSARDNVLEVPELLEAIILSLPVHDIFANAQRVSRTWNDVTRSPSIRTRLWLRSPINEVASPVDFLATPYENVQPSEHFPS